MALFFMHSWLSQVVQSIAAGGILKIKGPTSADVSLADVGIAVATTR